MFGVSATPCHLVLVMMVQQALTVLCLDVADGDDKKQEGEDCDCRSYL